MQYFYEYPNLGGIVRETDTLRFPTHLHKQPELLYVLEGTEAVEVDRQAFLLGPGDLAVILPHCLHSYGCEGESRALICIPPLHLLGEYGDALLRHGCREPVLRGAAVHGDVVHCLGALAAALEEPLARGYLAVLFGRILESLPLQAPQKPLEHDLLPRVLRHVQGAIREPLSLEGVAAALDVSKYRLSRMFSGQVGVSFNAYVNALRTELAQDMLRNTGLPITEIAYACGFESERTFYRAFRAHCPMTPRQYRALPGHGV